MNTTTTVEKVWAQGLDGHDNYWFTAAGKGYRLYEGTPDAIQFVAWFQTWGEMWIAILTNDNA